MTKECTSGWGLVCLAVDLFGTNQTNNADDAHRLVDLEEADGTENSGELSDLWGISGTPQLFRPTTTPNSKRYNGSASGLCIKKPIIGTKSGKATFGCY